MRWKKTIYIFILSLSSNIAIGQEKQINLYDSARYYYEKKDLIQAFKFYDTFYADTSNGQSNYDTYFAAVAACHAGQTEKAKYYLKRSAEIGYDLDSYNFFANDTLNQCLHELPEWKKFIDDFKTKADSANAAINAILSDLKDSTKHVNISIMDDENYWQKFQQDHTVQELIAQIKSFHDFDTPNEKGIWTLYQIKVNDTLTIPYLLYIPDSYTSSKSTPLYVYLHGAVVNRSAFSNPAHIPNGKEIKIMDRTKDSFILYPFGKKDFGWIYQQEAFETILREIVQVKSRYNIDDNKVYVGGHSNGGSGAFWLALNKPSMFAAFFGLNFLPKVYTGNTTIKNLGNDKTFYGISGIEDDVFPYPLVNQIYTFSREQGANWRNYAFHGSHGLAFNHVDSINFLFDTLATHRRNPFPNEIYWETDDVRNGRYAWIAISKLDTVGERADWHQPLNPMVTQNGKTEQATFTKSKSGAVRATIRDNIITIESSCVAQIELYLSPDMIDFDKQVKIYVNGKNTFNFKPQMSKETILNEFLKTKNRKFIVASIIKLGVK
ncbi:hypothetical protein [Olivibacter sitiensis]|uniref:hypothetical protein n=1 Tax=Olivibacter sitiensis TaxID=376470 RepID=UPI0004031A1D|nr:hypothetical protein [Olivibacter sitiensis]